MGQDTDKLAPPVVTSLRAETKIDLPPLIVESLGSGAEILASYLTVLAETGLEDPENHADTPELTFEHDTAVRLQPSRHVDYLSHDWREDDIWSSWKYIVSKKGDYTNAARLENASWRSWMKVKNKLKTVSPETLNWPVFLYTMA
ncbi:hypothetical protein F5883DRAFT_404230 [Diaporthe sp. PMI_573]|nr:hypothetical protein F5883DRAFT_404230 [Diaporthaceae sp. PMI_573]